MRREVIPAALLVAGAVFFAFAVNAWRVGTWSGPGFSMFASVDHRGNRIVTISVTAGDGTRPAVVPEAFEEPFEDQLYRPHADDLRESAEAILDLQWSLQDDGRYVAGDGVMAERVRLNLITVHVDGDDVVIRTIHEAEASR